MTLIKNLELTHTFAKIYIWISHPRDPEVRGWNFVSYREVLLVFWCTFTVLGDLDLFEVKKGFLARG